MCATSCMLGKWMKGWRKTRKWEALSFCCAEFGEVRKGRVQEKSTRISINSVSFIECRGQSLVWGNVVLLDYNVWLAHRAGTDRTATGIKISLARWKRVTCFESIMTLLLHCHTRVRICDFLIPPTWYYLNFLTWNSWQSSVALEALQGFEAVVVVVGIFSRRVFNDFQLFLVKSV